MSQKILSVDFTSQSYDIVIAAGALPCLRALLNLDRKVLIVTDANVPPQYADTVAKQCAFAKKVVLAGGEGCKNLTSYTSLLQAMLDADFTRADCVVAVGGGVVGDISAFAASTYMRGIDFYNIPTTLLSQVDSSIGGKTGVNFSGVKNIVGSFYQPKKVVIDVDTLQTLDARLLYEGLAESIKMAASCDAELFAILEDCTDLHAALPDIIYRSLCIKKAVVEQDEKESGLRRVLNFGHTIGHAIEGLHEGSYFHGECVAMGMIPMASGQARARLASLLQKYHLPFTVTDQKDALLPYLLHDKKRVNDKVGAVLVKEIGSFEIVSMSPAEILARLEETK